MPGENIQDWSTTAASNSNADSLIDFAEGQARASVNNSARSMMAAHAKDRNLHNGSITAGGVVNALTFSSGLTYTSTPIGLTVRLYIPPALLNTGSCTLNMDNIGAVAILKNANAAALRGGELLGYQDFRWDGTNWILLHDAKSDFGLLESQIASNSATIDFTTGIDGTYDEYQVHFSNVVPASDGFNLALQLGVGSPPVMQETSNYIWTLSINANGALVGSYQTTTYFPVTSVQSNSAAVPAHGRITLCSPSLSIYNVLRWESGYLNNISGNLILLTGAGYNGASTGPFTGLRFLMTNGNITSGNFQLYGLKK